MSLIIANEVAPATPSSGNIEIYSSTGKRASQIDDSGAVISFAGIASTDNLTNKTLTAPILSGTVTGTYTLGGTPTISSPTINTPTVTGEILTAGTINIAPLTFTGAGSALLNTPATGAEEFDATAFYDTVDLTSGRTQRANFNIFRLTADGSALGPTIADYFGATSAFPFVLNGVYLLQFYLWFLKTTAGTVTWTLTNTQTYTNLDAYYDMCPVGGIGTNGAQNGGGVSKQTAAATALPVTGTLTTATDQFARIVAIMEMGTAGNVRLRITSSAGTVTPRRGSFYTAQRLFAGNVGTFVA